MKQGILKVWLYTCQPSKYKKALPILLREQDKAYTPFFVLLAEKIKVEISTLMTQIKKYSYLFNISPL